ncbi:MAG: hypothetical protein ACXADW_19605, partial [Candidatus Hodarchaeales archaeon]
IGILLTTKRYKKCCFVDCSRRLGAIFFSFDLIFGLFDAILLHKSANIKYLRKSKRGGTSYIDGNYGLRYSVGGKKLSF